MSVPTISPEFEWTLRNISPDVWLEIDTEPFSFDEMNLIFDLWDSASIALRHGSNSMKEDGKFFIKGIIPFDLNQLPVRSYWILKRGLFYRPNSQGYTAEWIEAGIYTLDEAMRESYPNGRHGPRDGITIVPLPIQPQHQDGE